MHVTSQLLAATKYTSKFDGKGKAIPTDEQAKIKHKLQQCSLIRYCYFLDDSVCGLYLYLRLTLTH